MRLRGFPSGPMGPEPVTGGAERGASDRPNPLYGSWSATRWQYTSQEEPSRTVDLVADLKGAVTLSLSAGNYVLTHELGDRGHLSMGGSCAIEGEMLELRAEDSQGSEIVRFRIAGDTLALTAAESGWDFDGDGLEEPAFLVAVFVRL